MKHRYFLSICMLIFVSCAKQSSETLVTDTDTCAVLQDSIVEPQYQYVEAVDLGLSVLWADRNLGASEPADCGGYYPSLKAQDTVKALLGVDWRLPTVKEMEELFHRCLYGYDTYMIDKNGVRVRGKLYEYKKGTRIFLPAAGFMDMEKNINDDYGTKGIYATSSHMYNGEYCNTMWGGYWDDDTEFFREIIGLGEGTIWHTIRPVKDK